ncbi:MAG: hypothetical protein IK990_03715 [Ruminiclostridium sp.]|nr:hypothetical protein [Ruminiclostridium sp.]MBP3854710.1 hypothetical protein [Ruminiclostridium sp.]
MNLHNDLMKAKIEHDCSQCSYKCGKRSACEDFVPEDMDDFMEYVVDALMETVVPSKDKKLKRRPVKSKIPYDDKIPTMDYYYVALVNDTLSEIRRGYEAYIFNFEQLRDVMSFEPSVFVEYIPEAESYKVMLK